MPSCIVPGCKSYFKRGKKLSFHEFPSDEQRRNEWLKAIQRQGDKKGSDYFPSQYSTVCALHFSDDCFKPNIKKKILKQNAVPSIFPSHPSNMLPKETTPRPEIKKFALDVDDRPVAVKAKDSAKEQNCNERQVLGEVSQCQTLLEPKYPSIKSLNALKVKCLLINTLPKGTTTPRPEIRKFALDVGDRPVAVKAKDTAKEQSCDKFQVLGEASHCQTPLKPEYPCSESLSPLKKKCLLVNMLPKGTTTPRREIRKFALDVDNCPAAVKAKDTAKEQTCDKFQILGEVSRCQTQLKPEYSCTESSSPQKRKCLLVNMLPKGTTTPRTEIRNFALDVGDRPAAVKAEDTAKEQSYDKFQVLGEVSRCQTPLKPKSSCTESLSPLKKKCLLVNMLPKKTTPPRPEIRKFELDVDDPPASVKAKNTAKEQICDKFQVLGEASRCQTSLKPEYPCSESLSALKIKCLLVNKKLRNKTSVLSKAKKKLATSNEKYDSLLKSYKNLRNEYESLNLDKLNEMESNNLKRRFLLDQLSALSNKKPKWSESTIRACIKWHSESPAGYRFARGLGFLTLPSESTLNKYK